MFHITQGNGGLIKKHGRGEWTDECKILVPVLAWKIPCTEGPAVHGVARSRTRLSNFTFTFHFHALEKEMATHSSVLAWRIPGTGKPGGPLSMGSHRVRHDWSDLAAAAAAAAAAWYYLVEKGMHTELPTRTWVYLESKPTRQWNI